MAKTKEKKLTKVQREILDLLDHGHIMEIDRMNMASISDRNVAPQTRYFLTKLGYVTRKDKAKSVETHGNGFVITHKGTKALLDNPGSKRRETLLVLKKEKKCAKCDIVKPIENFVTIYGYVNPRAKYCRQCFMEREQEFVRVLLDGRDFCLYCGKRITKAYDWTREGKSKKTYISLDHMDPLCLGGDDSGNNTVYCCVSCNSRKSRRSFTDWLNKLESPYKELARNIYQEKHGRSPEEFKPQSMEVSIVIDLNYLKEYL